MREGGGREGGDVEEVGREGAGDGVREAGPGRGGRPWQGRREAWGSGAVGHRGRGAVGQEGRKKESEGERGSEGKREEEE